MNKQNKEVAPGSDFINLAVVLSLAVVIGIYLIVTTILIAEDGALYTQLARMLAASPKELIRHPIPPGYPFCIFLAHKLTTFFTQNRSIYGWIYAAQSAALFCRLLALVALYFVGKLLVGARKSFWALLVLIVLPYPARLGSDALRDWPHLLFFAVGFLAIMWAIESRRWWFFGPAGLAAGLGYLIRPMCLQLVVCGAAWLGCHFVRPANSTERKRIALALALLIVGFLLVAIPYARASGKVLPSKLKGLVTKAVSADMLPKTAEPESREALDDLKYAAGASRTLLRGIGTVFNAIGENMMWLFAVSSLIGLAQYFYSCRKTEPKLLIAIFLAVNMVILLLRCTNFDKAMSKRYLLPLTSVIVFYSITGLEILSGIFAKKHLGDTFIRQQKRCFHILLATGVLICLPKLVQPMRSDKQGYLDVADWLRNNTAVDDQIAVPDRRIALYAERKEILSKDNRVPPNAAYIVQISTNGGDQPPAQGNLNRVFHAWSDLHKKKKKLEVYKVM